MRGADHEGNFIVKPWRYGERHAAVIFNFFGENLPQVQALGYQMTDDSEAFEEMIGKAIAELDSGDGVLVLTDLFAGTPAHKTTRYLKPGQVDVICGVNLPLFLELLGLREAGDLELSTLMQTGKDGIRLWEVAQPQSDDDFF